MSDPSADPHRHTLDAIRRELDRLGDGGRRVVPAWKRVTPGEHRWPAASAIVVAIGLQLLLPDQLTLVSRWLLPSLELVVLVVLAVTGPARMDHESALLRGLGLALVGLLSVANAVSAGLLVTAILDGSSGGSAAPLLASGAAIWLTNIIAFAVWYWQLDRGGPAARAHGRRPTADFLFVQMQSTDPHDADWEPRFADYLYLSFTNATAFSPTDVMPLSRWAKMLMLVQALVSLVTIALVVSRAVNVLGG